MLPIAEFLAGVFLGWLLLYLVLRRLKVKRLNYSFIYVLYRSEGFLSFLERLSRFKRLWGILADIGIAIFVFCMGYAFYFMGSNIVSFYTKPLAASRLIPIIPGLTVSIDLFLLMIPSILVVIVTHEAAHALAARCSGMKLKSAGFFLAFIFPGAFVEPDEDSLKKASTRERLRLFSAGSSANMVLALLVLVPLVSNAVFYALISPFYGQVCGVQVLGVAEGYPAYGVLRVGDVILAINDTPVGGIDSLRAYMAGVRPGENLTLLVLREGTRVELTVGTENVSGRAVMGVYLFDYYPPRAPWLPARGPYDFYRFLVVSFLVASSIALINALPIPPLDGDKFLLALLGEKGKALRWGLAAASILLLSWNVFLSLTT